MKITWTPFFHQESIPNKVNCGYVTYHQPQLLELMLSTYKMISTKNFKLDKLVKLVFAQLEKNFIPSASMNWSVKSQLIVLREVSYLLELEMKLKWPSKLTRLFMNHQLLMVWEKHSWPNKRKMRCKLILLNLDKHAKNSSQKLPDWTKKF